MINRGLQKTSQYVFNADTGMLEKLDTAASTIESLSNQANGLVSKLDEIAEEVNQEKDSKDPVNNITVITADDNLIHNYFYDLDVSWDSFNCLSTATIKMPKMNTENTTYWATYQGQLTIYVGYNFTFDYVNSNSYEDEQDAANSLSKYWDNSDIKPMFRGEIARVKEYNTEIKLYVDSIGRRFQQKIPDEFRQAYINNQNVRDAFQAICEFLGVQYICPPKTVTDNGEEETTEEEGTEEGTDDASTKSETENNIQSTVSDIVNRSNSNSSSDSDSDSDSDSNSDNEEENEEGEEDDELTNNEEIEQVQNGYGNINFDANGTIVCGSAAIETSPDMADTLQQMDENPLEKYLEDETGIVEKVQALLDGDMFDELHNKIMNYDAITIEPKASSSSSVEGTGSSTGADSSTDSNSEEENENSGLNGWHNGQLYENGKVHLYPGYINNLSPSQAEAKYITGQSTYTPVTLNRLKTRAGGSKVS